MVASSGRRTRASTRRWSHPAQIGAVRDVVTASHGHITTDAFAHAFKGAKKKELATVLDALAALGIVLAYDAPDGKRWRRAGA